MRAAAAEWKFELFVWWSSWRLTREVDNDEDDVEEEDDEADDGDEVTEEAADGELTFELRICWLLLNVVCNGEPDVVEDADDEEEDEGECRLFEFLRFKQLPFPPFE